MSTAISYYFSSPGDGFPLPDFFDGLADTWEILLRVKEALRELFSGPSRMPLLPGVELRGPVQVGRSSEIHPGAVIYGPAVIGERVEVMPGAMIRPYTVIADGCSVGFGSEVKASVMLTGSKVASNAFVGDSVLGAKARIGSGVITANRRFDQSDVTLSFGGEKVSLGGDYFGLVLGDSSRVGANAVTQPGAHVGPHSWIFPLVVARGFVPRQTRVLNQTELVFQPNEIRDLKP